MRVRSATLAAITLSLMLLIAVGGCRGDQFVYLTAGRDYTLENVTSLATLAESPSFKGRPTADAEALRHDQLVALRSKGDKAAELATLLTSAFPDEKRSVPFFAEEATVAGQRAWVVVEVWGSEGGALDRTRLWVFDMETGVVLLATSSR